MKLNGKVAVVTGGGSGLGAAICSEFAREGAWVAVCDIRYESAVKVVKEIELSNRNAKSPVTVISDNVKVIPVAFDVANKEAVDNAAEKIKNMLGAIDIWVNCAGISKIQPFLNHTEEMWDMTMNINLKGPFFGCQAAVRQMLPKKSGVIINISSQSGKAGNSHYQAYCASKFGVIGLTQSLAMEFAKAGIRVNAICPGVVFTPMWDEQKADYAKKRDMKPEEVKPYMEGKIPMGRSGEAVEVARVAVFLASDDSSYLTGQSLNVSGGSIMF